jgi:diketogulonate reductase-like aldo/keto reductase
VPLAETLEASRDLRNAGLIRNWGVGNFDVSDLDDLMSLPGSLHVVTDQVLCNPDAPDDLPYGVVGNHGLCYTHRSFVARTAAWTRFRTSSLRRISWICVFTVFSLR